MIDALLARLNRLGIQLTGAEDLADALWLAGFLTPQPASQPGETRPGEDATPPEQVTPPEPPGHQPVPIEGVRRPRERPLPLVQPSARGEGGATTGAQELWSPGASALPHALELSRALRPLRRRVPSRIRFVLNEVATAEQSAEAESWFPVLEPARTRWLDLALVVDAASSMAIWERTVEEIRALLERLGAFRTLRVWRLDTGEPGLPLFAGSSRSPRPRRELASSTGQRLVLVLSDCLSPAWRSGEVARVLEEWGRSGPVALAQLLPQRLWVQTSLRASPRVLLRAKGPGTPNRQLFPEYLRRAPRTKGWLLPLPTFALEPTAMAAWARMLSGAAGAPPLGVMLAVPERGAAVGANGDGASVELPEEDGAALSADERVARFYESASTLARELAWCLSAVPLSLPVMRLVQRAVLPESSQVHLAEVFLGGLLRRVTPKAEPVPPDDVQYDFHEGVRERLMDSLSGQRAMKVLEHVSELVGLKLGRREDFRAALLAPAGSEAPVQVSAAQRPFAVLMASVLRRFGPRYLKIIEVLERQAPEAPASTAVPGAQEAQHAPGAQPSWVTSVYGTFPLERVSTVPLNETYFRAISLRYAAKPFRRRAQVIPGRYHRTSWTLHLADSQITSVYEAQAFAFAAQQLAILPIHLHLKSVLDLRDETTLRTLGLTREELAANFRNLPAGTQTKTQALGEQCVASGRIDGILYPSLAYEPGTLLVVFVDNLKRLGSYLEFTDPPTGKKLRLPERR